MTGTELCLLVAEIVGAIFFVSRLKGGHSCSISWVGGGTVQR